MNNDNAFDNDYLDNLNLEDDTDYRQLQHEQPIDDSVVMPSLKGELMPNAMRASLASRIQEMAEKRYEGESVMEVDEEDMSVGFNNDGVELGSDGVSRTRKKRTVITVELLERMKPYFERYRQDKDNSALPPGKKIKMKQISKMFNLSNSESKSLYDQFCKDPLFMGRRTRAEVVAGNREGMKRQPNSINSQRVDFIRNLVKEEPYLSVEEIHERMTHVDLLHQINPSGSLIPIPIKTVAILLSQIKQPRRKREAPMSINYRHRFKYARRYLEITDDKTADICFVGEYSFVNNYSMGSCPNHKKDTFVMRDRRGGARSRPVSSESVKNDLVKLEEDWGRDIQYIAAITLYGIIYYEIFNNIYEQMNFYRTISAIGQAMNSRNETQKKYLILEFNPIHKQYALRKLESLFGIKVLFIPPMAPMLNPTEYLFSDVKTQVRSKANKYKNRSYLTLVRDVLKGMETNNMQENFMRIKPYLQLSLEEKPFK